MEIGPKVRYLRKQQKLTLQELAQKAQISVSYLGDIEKGRSNPSIDTLLNIAKALETPPSYFLDDKIDLLDLLDKSNQIPLTVSGNPVTQQQRLNILRALENPESLTKKTNKIPILGAIRAGIPLLSDENYEGELEIPGDIIADFALQVRGDSMIGAGIHEGDYAICRKQETAHSGDIVVAVHDSGAEQSETTLKYFFNNEQPVLRAANPDFKDIPMGKGYRIGGVMVALLRKESTPYNYYREYLSTRNYNLQEWNEVIEIAANYGIKPDKIKSILEMHWEMMHKK